MSCVAPGRLGAISLNIKEKSVLYAAYMPYVRGGGIFIPTARPYKLGDEIFMLISLLDDPGKLPVAGVARDRRAALVWLRRAAEAGEARAAAVLKQLGVSPSVP